MKKILIVDDDATTRHVVRRVLTGAGFSVAVAKDGVEGLKALKTRRFDLLLLDVWMPRLTGLELLAKLRATKARPRVIVMTSDDTPQTVLETVREKAFKYVHKPVEALALLQTVREVLAAADPPAVEVISARPEWVELIVPCTREAAERLQTVMAQLDTDLPFETRESIGYAFRELLLNAIEWGGRLDPKRTVRIACLRTPRMLMYRIADPGTGFRIDELPHAAIGQPSDDPIAHMHVREAKGLRPGGFGLLMVRESVDDLIYNEKRNEVVFVKYLADGAAPSAPAPVRRTPRRRQPPTS
jgi:CheY-like chemotaxis protein/anti-sigma regulatory factor (Ser/Thr protein kinase)